MRYLSAPAIESDESRQLPMEFGKLYQPACDVTLADDVPINAPGLDMPLLDGEVLVIEPNTVSWAFLTRRESSMVKELSAGRTTRWLREQWPQDALGTADEFVTQLFQRGIVTLGGLRSIDQSIFADSPNVREGHLVELLLTEKCNLACGYCLAGAAQHMPHMSDEVAYRTVDLAYAMDTPDGITFEFSGGEPFLRFRLMQDLVEYIRNHPRRNNRTVYVSLQTNGTLLDEQRVEWIRQNGIIVGLSLDGDPASHNHSRPQVNGGESFSKVLRGIDLLQRADVGFGVLLVLNRSNIGSVQSMVDFLVENGISSIKLNPVAYLGTGRQNWNSFGVTQDEVVAYFRAFIELIVERGCPIIEANLFDMVRHVVSKQRHSRCIRGYCGAGDTFSAIAADGSIYPCGRATQSPKLKLGHVLSETGCLNASARNNSHILEIRVRRPGTLEDCTTCTYRELCQSGCSAQAFERYGTVRHKTPECTFYKSMYPFLMRWLSFDDRAVTFFNRGSYFGGVHALQICRRQFLTD
jgi:uncharacterized protein